MQQLLDKLQALQKSIDISTTIHLGMSHGDFTPWNMYSSENKLHVCMTGSWHEDSPLLFDVFHFIFQREVMLKKSSFEKNWSGDPNGIGSSGFQGID